MVDPKGYLTDLNSLKIASDAAIGDIKKARALLSSVTSTNPKHGPGWIAAARIELAAGKVVQARKLIRQGCDICPESEDVWIEAAVLHKDVLDNAKAILAEAARHIPTSVKVWLLAADFETTDNAKKIVLRRALEFIPNSVQLWRTAIQLEGVEDARIMLARAVECIPHSVGNCNMPFYLFIFSIIECIECICCNTMVSFLLLLLIMLLMMLFAVTLWFLLLLLLIMLLMMLMYVHVCACGRYVAGAGQTRDAGERPQSPQQRQVPPSPCTPPSHFIFAFIFS